MSIHFIQNVVSLGKSGICMWEKYRHESQQTICIIGVLILAAKLCRADGHFSEIKWASIAVAHIAGIVQISRIIS